MVENARVWHKNVQSFSGFVRKRMRWLAMYSSIYAGEKKDFQWVNDRGVFFRHVVRNLVLLPAISVGIRKARQYRDLCWLLHPFLLFLTTLMNILYALTSRRMLRQIFRSSA